MKYSTILVLGMICLASSCSAQLYDEWIKSVDTLGASISFHCIENGVHPKENISSDFNIVQWMLPDFKRVDPGQSLNGAYVDVTGTSLTINSTAKEDLGVYHCMLQNANSTWRLVKWGLNMRGPYFNDLLQKYTKNLIIGFSAFGGFLLLAISVILIYRYRWQSPKLEEPATVYSLPETYNTSYNLKPGMSVPGEEHVHAPEQSKVMKAEEAEAVAALAAATAGEPDIPGSVTPEVTNDIAQPSKAWSEQEVQGYSNLAATLDDGTTVATTPL